MPYPASCAQLLLVNLADLVDDRRRMTVAVPDTRDRAAVAGVHVVGHGLVAQIRDGPVYRRLRVGDDIGLGDDVDDLLPGVLFAQVMQELGVGEAQTLVETVHRGPVQ